MIFRSPADVYEEVDLAPYVAMLRETFGIPAALFEPYFGYKPNREAVWIVRRDLRLPLRPDPFAAGMPFFYHRLRFPRPTTPTAIRWGHLALRNVYDVDDAELGLLIDYQDVFTDRLLRSQVPAYQLLRHRGHVLGVAIATHDDDDRVLLKTFTPKVWRLRLQHLVADDETESESESEEGV
jgi:hypothetical protein